jgi:hypothetical protein
MGNASGMLISKNCAHQSVKLTQKRAPLEFNQDQIAAMKDLKQASLTSPALQTIDYKSSASVILSVNTSQIAVGFILS